MLYYIIPPIIIVVTASVLIFFLFRKVSDIPAEELSEENKSAFKRKMQMIFPSLKHFFLRLLEKIMHHFKLLSLKFHNISNQWFHSIKKKREEHLLEVEESVQEENNLQTERKEVKEIEVEAPPVFKLKRSADAIVRPIPRNEVIKPKEISPKEEKELKDQLEGALIKRIAINPKDIEAYERLGDYYFEQLNLVDSLECYKQVIKLSPMHYKAKTKIRKIERMLA